jgi:DNA-binding transcriptional LysR family regulator
MELRHLRYFVAVADERSFSRAAQRLLVSQPSLSRQIQALERQLGYDLFVRGPRGIVLTPAGEALLVHARQMLALEAETPHVLSEASKTREVVKMGVPPGVPDAWLLELVRSVQASIPNGGLSFTEASSTEQLRRMEGGQLDLVVVHQVPPEVYESEVLWVAPLGIAVRPGHPLASKPRYHLTDLDSLRVLAHSQDQVPTQQEGLLAATMTAQVWPRWQFCQFVEHALACAEAVSADAVLVAEHTAAAQLPGWRWRPVDGLVPAMTTWLVRRPNARAVVREVAATIVEQSRTGTLANGKP